MLKNIFLNFTNANLQFKVLGLLYNKCSKGEGSDRAVGGILLSGPSAANETFEKVSLGIYSLGKFFTLEQVAVDPLI